MFWKKKAEVKEGGEKKVEKQKVQKLPGPQELPELVAKHLITEQKRNPDFVAMLKAVVRPNPAKGEKAFDIRLFKEYEAAAKKVTVKNYTSLDEYPDLVMYVGWFDENSKQVELEEKAGYKAAPDVKIFTLEEIQQQIEGLSEPGSTVFFYLAGSPASGGPLGRGAAVVELNPNYPGKKQKKYNMYVAEVEGMQPAGKKQKLLDSDTADKIAKYVKEAHHVPYI